MATMRSLVLGQSIYCICLEKGPWELDVLVNFMIWVNTDTDKNTHFTVHLQGPGNFQLLEILKNKWF